MHELGIVFHIADTVTKIAQENNVSKVNKVVLEIGQVSTVVNTYLEDCWNWNASKTDLLKDCKIEIVPVKAISYCEDCKKEYPTIPFGKKCPHCSSEHTYLLQGNETTIKEIVVDDD